MGPTRFPQGRAMGFVNQFNYRGTTAGDISGLTQPNVTLGELFYTNNTGIVTITDFLLDDTANRLVNYEGKTIRVFCLDSATQVNNSGTIFLADTGNITANGSIDFMFSRGNWYETSRSYTSRNVTITARVGSAVSVNIDNGTKILLFQSTSAASQLKALSGGYVGQTITVLSPAALNSGGITAFVMSGGNIIFPGTNMFAVQTNAGLQLTKVANNDWRYLQPGTASLIN